MLDYAENIERHDLKDDIFSPKITTSKAKSSGSIDAECEWCKFTNQFAARPNVDKLDIDKQGFFLDLAGNRILTEDNQFFAAHFGRRCNGFVKSVLERGKLDRCEFRYASKTCEECSHENDIAARYCESCKAEIVDPNDSLTAQFETVKRDPYAIFTEEVRFFSVKKGKSKAGNDMLICEYSTDNSNFRAYYTANLEVNMIARKWKELNITLFGHTNYNASIDYFLSCYTNQMPSTVTYRKNKDTGYYDVFGHNKAII